MWVLLGGVSALAAPETDVDVGSFPILETGQSPGGLTAADVSQLLQQGHGASDIARADAISAQYGVSVSDLLARRAAGNSWEDVTAAIVSSRSSQEAAQSIPDEAISVVAQDTQMSVEAITQLREQGYSLLDISYAHRYGKDYGLSAAQVLQLKGRADWEQMAKRMATLSNFSLDPELVDRTGLDEATLQAFVQQGHELRDVIQAAALAQSSERSVQEVLALKKGRDWASVARELFPDAAPPVVPEGASVPGSLKMPSEQRLPVGSEAQPAGCVEGGSEGQQQVTPQGQRCYPDRWVYVPGYYTYIVIWEPVYIPGYFQYYWYYDWWCRCYRTGWYYVPGYTIWVQRVIPVWHPGYWYRIPGYCEYIPDYLPPVTSPSYNPSSPTGSNGWYSSPFAVTLSATDSDSGVKRIEYGWDSVSGANAIGTSSTWNTYTGSFNAPGDGIWRLRYRSIDNDGNVESTKTSTTPFRQDRVAPNMSSTRTAANTYGWNNSNVTVSFSCSDAVSGVSTCSAPVTVSSEGTNLSTTGSARDMAGNQRGLSVAGINIDKTLPTLSATRTAANGYGWNNTSVTVSFSCADALSGLSTCSGPVTVSSEGYNQSASGSAEDKASNQRSLSVAGINIDKTLPTLSATRTEANGYGWNNTSVTVSFSCGDALSGLSACSDPVTVSSEGYDQSVSGSAEDKASNQRSLSMAGINIDKTLPALSLAGGQEYTVDQTVLITCAASDALSGLVADPCTSPLVQAEAYEYNPGTYSASAEAADKAGNTTSASASYSIRVTAASLGNLVERFIPEGTPGRTGLVNSLLAKLQAIAAADEHGNTQAKEGATNAFVNEVEAQTGKALPASKAAILNRLVQYL